MLSSDFKLAHEAAREDAQEGSPVRVIAVTSGKGGTGKTNIAVNLSLALAIAGHRTLLLDADLGMASVDVLLGLHVQHNLSDVLGDKCRLEDIIIDDIENLLVIPAASGIKQLAESGMHECAGLIRAFSDLKHPVDTFVIDTATGISESVSSFCRAATEILVVVCNEPASIRDSASQIRMLFSEYRITRFRILANMVETAAEGEKLFKSMLQLFTHNHDISITYAGYIPADNELRKAVFGHQPVITASPKSRSAMAIKALARRVMDWPRPEHASGHLEFFVERLVNYDNVKTEVMT